MTDTADTTLTNDQLQVGYTGEGANWDVDTDLVGLEKLRVRSIQFNPSAAGDIIIIREGGASGAIIMQAKCTNDQDQRVKYFGDRGKDMSPYIVLAQQTFGTPANASILFDLL